MEKFFARKILWWIPILLGGIIIFFVVSVRTYFGIDKMQNLFVEENFIDDISINEIVALNGIVKESETYRIVGEDPYIIYSVERLNSKGIQLIFSTPFNNGGEIQLFYSQTVEGFSEEQSVKRHIEPGENSVVIPVRLKDVCFLRIDTDFSKNLEFQITNIRSDRKPVTYNDIFNNKYLIGNLLISICILALIIVIYKSIFYKEGEIRSNFFRRNVRQFVALFCIVTIIFLILYQNFIIGVNCYLYYDVGSDTYFQYWPKYLFHIDFCRNGGNSGYSLQKGLGEYVNNAIGYFFNPFDWTFFIMDSEKALIFSLYLKIVWIVFFSWLYFRRKFRKDSTTIICSILWCFNGWLVLWGQHYAFATSLAYFTSIVFFLEAMIEKKRYKVFLPVVLALLTGHSYYMMYMIGIFCVIYILVHIRNIKKASLLIIELAVMEIVAILMNAIQIVPMVDTFVHSARTDALKISLLELLHPRGLDYLISYMGRMLSTNFWGISGGNANYYEMAVSYVSCLGVFAVVYFFQNRYWKKNLCFLMLCAGLVMFPLSSKLFVFNEFSYRWTFLLNFVLLIITGYFLDLVLDHIEKNDLKCLKITLLISNIIIGTVIWVCYENTLGLNAELNEIYKIIFCWCFIDITLCFILWGKRTNRKRITIVLIILVSFEQILMNDQVINGRGEISVEELELSGYNDGTKEIVDNLKKVDMSLYRINKSFDSVDLDDSYIQGYYGVASYGSTNGKYVCELWEQLEIPFIFGHKNYLRLDAKQLFANELLGVKYVIRKDKDVSQKYFKEIVTDGTKTVYEDVNALPFGYLYTKKWDKSFFDEFKGTDKRSAALMVGFYFTDNDTDDEKEGYEELKIAEERLEAEAIKGRDRLKNSNVKDVLFEDSVYSAKVINENDENTMFCVPLIYSERWKACVDGSVIKCYNINGGLVGLEMPTGEHNVTIEYMVEDYKIAGIITVVASVFYIVFLILYVWKKGILNDKI